MTTYTFDAIYDEFSPAIKQSYTGKVLAEQLKAASMLSTGKFFPQIVVLDQEENKHSSTSFAKDKYALIDFWYSNCAPCIAQFEQLKKPTGAI